MMTLRCTRRLMEYFDVHVTKGDIAEGPAVLLGDWYADLLRHHRIPLALCVNEKTRYAIVVPLKECEIILCLYIRLAQRMFYAMRRAGIAEDTNSRVLDEHRGGVRIARTASRGLLGTMNDLARHLKWHLEQRGEHAMQDPSALEQDLNKIPHRPLGWANATERLIELCGSPDR